MPLHDYEDDISCGSYSLSIHRSAVKMIRCLTADTPLRSIPTSIRLLTGPVEPIPEQKRQTSLLISKYWGGKGRGVHKCSRRSAEVARSFLLLAAASRYGPSSPPPSPGWNGAGALERGKWSKIGR